MNPTRTRTGGTEVLMRRKAVAWGSLYAVLLSTFAVSATWGFEPEGENGAAQGLRGIFPDEAPYDISFDAFGELGDRAKNWMEWSDSAAELVSKLYEDESLDAAGQREVIAGIKRKVGVIEKALADDRYRSIHGILLGLKGRLSRRIALAEAVLDTLELDPAQAKALRVRAAAAVVADAAGNVERDLDSIKNGSPWKKYLRTQQLKQHTAQQAPAERALAVIDAVQAKLAAKDSMSEQQRQFIDRKSIAELEEALDAYSQIAGRPPRAPDMAELRNHFAAMVGALEEYELTKSRVAAANARKAAAQLREVALDGGQQIDDVLQDNYFNYNVRIAVSEAFLSRLAEDRRTERGQVRDYILGASVYGNQTTNVKVGVDLKPSNNGARFDITLTGTTHSNTQGVTSQATIYTQGQHHIRAAKEVTFDGERFHTKPARASVDANNYTTGARTKVSGFPLLGAIADSYAMGVARGKRAESEAIAAQRVKEQALPKFDNEVEQEFRKANDELENRVRKTLRENKLMPDAQSVRTTDSKLMLSARLMGQGELGGSSPSSLPELTKGGLALYAHESMMNNAIDRMPIAGKTLTDAELVKEVEKSLSTLLGREVNLKKELSKEEGAPEPEPAPEEDSGPDTFVFDEHDPIRIRIADGELQIVIRAGFKQEGKDDIPPQEVTVPLKFQVVGNDVHVERGTIRVSPLQDPESVAVQIARAGAIRKKIENALPPRQLDRTISVKRPGRSDFAAVITEIKAGNGWIGVAAQ